MKELTDNFFLLAYAGIAAAFLIGMLVWKAVRVRRLTHNKRQGELYEQGNYEHLSKDPEQPRPASHAGAAH